MPSFLVSRWSWRPCRGFRTSPILRSISPLMMSSGRKYVALLVAGAHHLHGLGGEVEYLAGVLTLGQELIDYPQGLVLLHVGHGLD